MFLTSSRIVRLRIVPPDDAKGTRTISGIDPFIMNADGKGWIFAPNGLLDGPLPTHYEPQESTIRNPLYAQQCNPARMEWVRGDNRYQSSSNDPEFPLRHHDLSIDGAPYGGWHVAMAGWLSELQPEMFCEVSPELARGARLCEWRLGDDRAPRAPRSKLVCW